MISAIITGIIVIALSFFSDENPLGNLEFGFIDDINEFLDSEMDSNNDTSSMSQEIAGISVAVNDYYHDADDNTIYIVDISVGNEDKEYFSLSPNAFHIETGDGNTYAYTDLSREYSTQESDTGVFNEPVEIGTEERYLIAFQIPSYLDFNSSKTFVYDMYVEDEQLRFDLGE